LRSDDVWVGGYFRKARFHDESVSLRGESFTVRTVVCAGIFFIIAVGGSLACIIREGLANGALVGSRLPKMLLAA
jgi:hypothetical protein